MWTKIQIEQKAASLVGIGTNESAAREGTEGTYPAR